jgi:uncharacterized membrane-anchored protein YitT (DUF2179 family)
MMLLPYLGIILGSFIFAFGLNYFIIANGLAESGFTGIALILHYLKGWPVGTIIFTLNIPLFFVGWKMWGKAFILKTLLAVVSVSLSVDLTSNLSFHTSDLLLSALYGGVLSGIGIGLVLRSGATTGGADIIARFIYEKTGISMGKVFFAIDLTILSMVAFLFGLEKALYTLVALFIFSRVIDYIIEGLDEARAVTIISGINQAIASTIINELERGATILKGYGAYTGKEKNVLYVVISKHELLHLKKIIHEIDPHAFISVTNVHEVLGEGFRPGK